jgi:DNA polymerase III subunit alpha, Gram-positive type
VKSDSVVFLYPCNSISPMTFVVVDIETTGLSRNYHKITEIAALQVKNGVVRKEFHTLVNPQVKIPSFITKFTGIDNVMVKDAPIINDVMPQFTEFLGDDVFVAHNATFDYGFLSYAAMRQQILMNNDRLCTRKLANRLLPELPSKRLGAICEHMNITNIQQHRAMGDARATVCIFNNFLEQLKARGISEREALLRFERS